VPFIGRASTRPRASTARNRSGELETMAPKGASTWAAKGAGFARRSLRCSARGSPAKGRSIGKVKQSW